MNFGNEKDGVYNNKQIYADWFGWCKSLYIYCFQEEYAVVAIPIKRMQQTIDDLAGRGWLSLISTDRKEYANRIIKSSERNISIFDNLNVNN